MKNKKPPFTATITGISHDGRGIATLSDGKTTFISGALPGETVTAQFTKQHSRYNEADTLSVENPSRDRTAPECPHFGICGGCSMQHITTTAQIALKQKTLLEQLKHFGQVSPESLLPALSGNAYGYRRKARLGVRYVIKKEKLLIGFREKSSRYLADLSTCSVLHPSVGQRLQALSDLISSLSIYEHIPQIEVAVSDQATALVFRHMAPFLADDIAKLIEFAKAYQFHIYLQPNAPAAIHKLWPQDGVERLSYFLPDYQLEMQFYPLDFTQVNGEINPLMIKQALQLLDPQPDETVLDLFCGLGNFTLPLARFAKQVTGVEGSQEMVVRANSNAALNHIQNTEFYAANLADIPAIKPQWMQRQYDKILLDPPRTGAKEILAMLPEFNAKKIIYVSCNPATLARDAGELVNQLGYKLKQIGVINMFPQTSHIEAMAVFEK
jgi:23S rRNA (uracil1939-C5)-methyltransferase